MIEKKLLLASDTDRPLDDIEADEFGFQGIAQKIAPSLADATRSDGMVIGIEGPWGSGKTTLLNFLEQELDKLKLPSLHIIKLAPWLTGDNGSLVVALTSAMADILDRKADLANPPTVWRRGKKQANKLGAVVRGYGAQTARTLAPLGKLAGLAFPAGEVVARGLSAAAELLDNVERKPTDAELKALISQKLRGTDEHFLIVLDDLDRLEPRQAVEVIRVVRSVADFPQVAYVMCYDRIVLAHALEQGLAVKDGDLFLQKIVQLTFSIPLPEPFDLRTSLRSKAVEIYKEVVGHEPDEDEIQDIRLAVDQEGSRLRTPRDVKLTLNAIRFAFRNLSHEVYFADLCRISLIKILHPALYRWLENYLALRSIIFTGDGRVEGDETTEIGEELARLLPSEEVGSMNSIWHLSNFVPGLQVNGKARNRVFQAVTEVTELKYLKAKRLGSPLHSRYYFAMCGPKTALPDTEFDRLLKLAESNPAGLVETITAYIRSDRPLGRSWFEHILDRLSFALLGTLKPEQLENLALAIAEVMDVSERRGEDLRFFELSLAGKATDVVWGIIRILRKSDSNRIPGVLHRLFAEAAALSWLVGDLFRGELFDHGEVGDRPKPEGIRNLTAQELKECREILRDRLHRADADARLAQLPDLARVLYGWRDIEGFDAPKAWVQKFVADDSNFLKFLLAMRGLAVSDRVYRPLHKEQLEIFLEWDAAVARFEELAALGQNPATQSVVSALRDAIKSGRH